MNKIESIDLSGGHNPPTGRELIRRIAWKIVSATLFSITPRRDFNGFRLFLLRLFGAKIEDILVMPSVKIMKPWNLIIRRGSVISDGVIIDSHTTVEIGEKTVVSQRTYICSGSHDYQNPKMPLISSPIRIGSGVWLCAEVFVGPGVSVGDGAVIGARAVVVKDMPGWSVCGGNPCRRIKDRMLVSD